MNKPQKGSLAIISGPPVWAKSTVIAEVLRRRRISTFLSPLPPGRGGEVNGVNYFLWTCPNLSA